MTDLYEFRELMCDSSCYIRVFDLTKGECIYDGPAEDLPEELEAKTVMSFDLLSNPGPWQQAAIELNIE